MTTATLASPRKTTRRTKIPSYRLHRGTGQAVVTRGGRHPYLGRYGSAESKERYERTVALWLVNHRQLPQTAGVKGPTVGDLVDAFEQHARRHYVRPDGAPTREHENFPMAAGPLRTLYASLPAREFGPRCLEAVRQKMIELGWCRTTINRNVGRVRQMFRWGVSQELVGCEVHQALISVAGRRKGRSPAPEPEPDPVKPVPTQHIDAVLPLASRRFSADLHRRNGIRTPGSEPAAGLKAVQ